MNCKSCKREIPNESIFCLHCGEKIVKTRADKKSFKVPKPKILADGTYFGRIMKDGIRYPIRGTTEAEYKAACIAFQQNIIDAKRPDNRIVRDCLSEYISIREGDGKTSPATIDSYLRRSRNNLQGLMDMRVKDLDLKAMQTAVNIDAKKYSGKTIHEAVSLVCSATGLKFPGLVKPDKAPKKKPPVYSSEDIRRLISALADIGGEVECAGLLALWLSLRRSEIKGLRWINIGENTISVVNARVYDKNHQLVEKKTKNASSTRRLICPPYILNKLNALPRTTEYVINMSTSGLWEGITLACKAAGIEHGYLHGLRHTNASVMELLAIPPTYSNKRGGWSKSHVRQSVYTDAMTEGEIAAAEKINNFFTELSPG